MKRSMMSPRSIRRRMLAGVRRRVRRAGLLGAVSLVSVLANGTPAIAGPSGYTEVDGVTITSLPNGVWEIVAPDGAIIQYDSFTVLANEIVNFIQPSAAARVLNRIVGPDPTTIAGQLHANGIVIFVNPAGVQFLDGAVVDVGGIYAAAAELSDFDFTTENYNFTNVRGSVEIGNASITADSIAAFVGTTISNAGTVSVPNGIVAMVGAGASESSVRLVPIAGGRIAVEVSSAGQADAGMIGVDNTGTITTGQGGQVVLGAGDFASLAMRSSGTIESREVLLQADGGGVRLEGGGADPAVRADSLSVDAEVLELADSVVVQADLMNVAGDIALFGAGTVRIGGRDDESQGTSLQVDGTIAGAETDLIVDMASATIVGVDDPGVVDIDTGSGTQEWTGDLTVGNAAAGGATQGVMQGAAIAVDGDLVGPGSLDLDATGGNVSLSGDVTATGDLELTASQDVSIGGDAVSGGLVDIAAAGNVTANDVVASGDATVEGTAGTVSANLIRSETGNASATAGMDVQVGSIEAAGDASANAGNNVDVGSMIAGDDIVAMAGNDVLIDVMEASDGTANDGENVLVDAENDAELGSIVAAGGVTVTAGNDVELGDEAEPDAIVVQAGGAVSVTANDDGADGGAVTVNGGIEAGGEEDDPDVDESVTIEGDAVTITGAVTAADAVTLTANEQDVMASDISAADAVAISATDGDVTVGDVTSEGDVVDIAAAGNVTANDVVASGDATVEGTAGTVSANLIRSETGNASATAGMDVQVGSIEAAGDASANAGNNVDVGSMIAGDDIVAMAGNDVLIDVMEASDGTANDGENVLVDAGNDAVLGSIGAEGDIRLDVTRNLTVTEALDGNGDLDVIATSATFGDTVTVDDAGSGAIAVEADSVRFEGDVSATSLDVNGDATIATGEIVTAEGQVWQGPVTIEFADGTRLLGTLVTLANGSTGDALDVVGDSRIQGQFTNTSLLFVGTTTLTGTTQIQPAGMNETSDGQLVRAAVHFDGAVLSDGGAQELTVTLGGNEWVVFGGDVGTGGQALGTVTVERDGGSVGQAVLILDGSVLSAESFVFDLEGGVDGPDGATFATIWTVGEDLQFAPQPEGENPPPSVTFEVGSSFEMSSTDSLTTAGGLLIDGEAATVTLNDLNVVGLVDVNASSIVLQDGSDYVSFTGFDFSVTPTRTGGGEAGLPTFGSPDGDADLSGFGALQNFRVLAFTDEIVIGDFGSGVSVFDLAPVGPSIQDVSEGLAGALPTTEGAQPVRAASSLGQAEREALEENLRLTIRELDEDERIAFAEGAGAVLEDPLLLTTVADPDDLIPPRKAERFNAAELQALGQRIVDGQEPLDGAMEAVAIEAFTTFEREEGRTPTDEEWTLAVASLIERGGAEVIQEQTRMIREGLEYFREIDRRLAAAGMTNAERQPYIDAWLSNELYNPRAFIPVRTPAVYAEWRQLTESPAVAEQPAIEEQVPTEEPAE